MNQRVRALRRQLSGLTYQSQVWQLAQALAFVQDSLPLVVDGVGAVAGLAAQLDVAALLGLPVHPALRRGGFDCKTRARVRRREKQSFPL